MLNVVNFVLIHDIFLFGKNLILLIVFIVVLDIVILYRYSFLLRQVFECDIAVNEVDRVRAFLFYECRERRYALDFAVLNLTIV